MYKTISRLSKASAFGFMMLYGVLAMIPYSQTMASPSTERYENFQIYQDSSGSLYLRLPPEFILLHGEVSVPLVFTPTNGLFKLDKVNGIWKIFPLTEREFGKLSLSEASYSIEYQDIDSDGFSEMLVRAADIRDDSFIFDGVVDGDVRFKVHNKYTTGLDLSGASSLGLRDINSDGYLDINNGAGVYLGGYNNNFFSLNKLSTAESDIVGVTPGEFRVGEDGSATYSIPLTLPDGVAGVKPEIGLTYSSNSGDSVLGRGWSLSGLSSISRCPLTITHDGYAGGVRNSNQALCLNGKRLIQVSGATRQANGSTYKLEVDDLSVIEIVNKGGSSSAYSIEGFKVYTRSGETHYYGDTYEYPDSSLYKRWDLKAIEDVKGNSIVYSYISTRGGSLISTISYSGNEVVFNYETLSGYYKKYHYSPLGNLNSLDSHLSSITVRKDGGTFRQYRIGWQAISSPNDVPHITSVQECLDTQASSCLKPTEFSWTGPVSGTYTQRVCAQYEQNDCTEWEYETRERPFYAFNSYGISYGGHTQNSEQSQSIDINGDGYTDLVYMLDDYWRILEFKPGSTGAITTREYRSWRRNSRKEYQHPKTIDYNGDGVADLLIPRDDGWHVITKNGSGYKVVDLSLDDIDYENALILDVNGDSLQDIVFEHDDDIKYYLNNGGNFSSAQILDFSRAGENYHLAKKAVIQSPEMKGAFVLDVNGDGISDFITQEKKDVEVCRGSRIAKHNGKFFDSEFAIERCRIGGGRAVTEQFDGNVVVLGGVTSSGTPHYNGFIRLEFLDGVDIDRDIRVADFNGDGNTDILFRKDNTWNYSISSGRYFHEPRTISRDILDGDRSSWYVHHRFLDFNSDGRADLFAYHGSRNFKIYTVTTPSPGELAFHFRTSVSQNKDDTFHFSDIDGDANLDLLYESSGQWKVKLAYQPKVRSHVIDHIKSGYAAETHINYTNWPTGTATHEDIDSSYYLGLSSNLKKDYYQPRSPSWVVESTTSNAYDSYSKSAEELKVSYKYGGLLVHKKGRGSAGFETLETLDHQTGVITTTKYSQTFPYIGMPVRTITKKATNILSETVNEYSMKTPSTGVYFPYVYTVRDKQWSFGSDNARYPLSHTYQKFIYDNDGNVTQSHDYSYASPESSAQLLKYSRTVNTYNGAGGGAAKGRLDTTGVKKIAYKGGVAYSTQRRNTKFEYFADGLLKSTTLSDLKQKTTYGYDSFGNKTSTCLEDLNSGDKRCSSLSFGSRGKYVASRTNALGETTAYLYNGVSADAASGKIWSTTETDPNGIANTKYFNSQGELIKQQFANGNTQNILRSYVKSDNVCSVSEACYFVRNQTSGKPDTYTWYDSFNRKIKSQVKAFNGANYNTQYFTFDEYGRGRSTSIHYFDSANGSAAPASTSTTQFNYDNWGRVVSEVRPDLTVNSRFYKGLTTEFTDANRNTRREVNNALGELISVTSPRGDIHRGDVLYPAIVVTAYKYDAYGNMIQVTNSSDQEEKSVSVYTQYNSQGQKLAMYDPDKGYWRYGYNGFGELEYQINANGQRVDFKYDDLGRKIRAEEQGYNELSASVSCWQYGTSKASKNVGKLIWSGKFDVSSSNISNYNCLANKSAALWQRAMSYDVLGRPEQTSTQINGEQFGTNTSYDGYGRVASQTMPGGVTVTNRYSNNYLKEVYQGSLLIKRIEEIDAAGRVTRESMGKNMQRTAQYDPGMGYLDFLQVKVGGQQLHSFSYGYDNVGNVRTRSHYFADGSNYGETFSYDGLNRLKYRHISVQDSRGHLPSDFKTAQTYKYDAFGNLTEKNGRRYNYVFNNHVQQTTSYPLVRKQLQSICNNGSCNNGSWKTFDYDASGNVLNDGSRTLAYTGFDKPYLIQDLQGQSSRFYYGPERARYLRVDKVQERESIGLKPYPELTQYTTHYVGGYERIERKGGAGDQVEHKYYIGNAVLTRTVKPGVDYWNKLFLHKDHQGSVSSITNDSGALVEQFIYDPWGKKQSVVGTLSAASQILGMSRGSATTKGYTGHEGIGHLNLVHMNGRVYDAEIGRFLQADPHVQSPNNGQNYNRYSYVLNNPMSYTDPSGYFFKKLGKFVKKYWRQIAAVIVTYFTAGAASGWAASWGFTGTIANGAVAGAISGAAGGFVATGSLKGAMRGALSGAVFGAIGAEIHGGNYSTLEQMGMHAVAGGVLSYLQGGKFGHGFISAGVMKGFGKIQTSATLGRTLIQALAGGTVSKLTGGKFANGAVTSALQYLVNEVSKRIQFASKDAEDYWNDANAEQKSQAARAIREEIQFRKEYLEHLDKYGIEQLYPEYKRLPLSLAKGQIAADLTQLAMENASHEALNTYVALESYKMKWFAETYHRLLNVGSGTLSTAVDALGLSPVFQPTSAQGITPTISCGLKGGCVATYHAKVKMEK